MEKFLPIGTIVKLKSDSKLVCIMGYYSMEYTDAIEILDYIGVYYPEGLLLHNNTISFNNEDIENVEFMGYENDDYKKLNNSLNNDEEIPDTEDELLVTDELESIPEVIITPIEEVIDTNEGISLDSEPENLFNTEEVDDEKFVIPHYEFDENGIIINN